MDDDLNAERPLGRLERECPVRTAIAVIAGKWKPAILRTINEQPRRYVDIRAEVAGITDQALTRHLRELRADGVIERVGDKTSYRLTPEGKQLSGIMDALESWGQRYLTARRQRSDPDEQ